MEDVSRSDMMPHFLRANEAIENWLQDPRILGPGLGLRIEDDPTGSKLRRVQDPEPQ